MTVGLPPANGVAWVCQARKEIPSTRKPRIALIQLRVRRAFGPSAGLNALTPFEIASSPVSEAPPLAKAFMST